MTPIPVTTLTTGGVTMRLDADGVITLSGTATRQIYQNFELPFPFRYHAGAYTHVRNNAVGNGGNVLLAWLNTAATQVASVTQNTINKIGTAASADMDIRYIRVTIANGTTLDNYQMRPSVEVSNAETEFEPYCGGSPNRIELANCKGGYFSTLPDYGLRVEGATLQDGTPTPDNPVPIRCVKAGTKVRAGSPMTTATAWINTSNQLAYSSDSFAVRLPIKPSTKYELYLDTAVSSLFRAGVTYSATLPVTGEPITLSPCVRDNAPNHITLTTGSGAKYIWIQIAKSQMQAIYSLTVIDKGTGTTYTPFAVSEVIVPCDLYEGDVWYPTTGVVEHVNGVRVFDGSELWTAYALEFRYCYFIDIAGLAIGGRRSKCSHFRNVPGCWTSASGDNGYFSDHPLLARQYFDTTTCATLAEWKAYLAEQYTAGTPVTMVYQMAEPVIEHYDPQPIFAPQGVVNVLQSPTDLPARLSATMMVRR